MNIMSERNRKVISILMVFTIIFELFATFSSNVHASEASNESLQAKEVDIVASQLKEMFADGVSQDNLNEYARKNYNKQELKTAERELGINYLESSKQNTNSYSPFISLFSWNNMGKCMYNKIKDEMFAMVNVGVIVKYAKKKAWKELAKVVIRYAKGAGIKTNIALVAAQLAVWAVECGMEWN